MKISVLLPTRDRLSLLRHAVHSVRRLDDSEWEIVISDNESSEDVGGYVESLEDPRIRYVRTLELLPVADNWNNALAHSTGEYVVMLGDDDALLANYFARTRQLIGEFDHPEVIYHNALCYAYPGVVPEEPDGFLRSEGYAPFLKARQSSRLPCAEARSLACEAMEFRLRFGFNMQFVTIKRTLVKELSGTDGFFRSPFPDYYAINHLFMRARTIVTEPNPLVVIGVSPQSYGFFHNNQSEAAGRAFLEGNNQRSESSSRQPLIPGTNINDGWLRAMEELHTALGAPAHPRPNYSRYRMAQIVYVYQGHYLRGTIGADELSQLSNDLGRLERALYVTAFSCLSAAVRVLPPRFHPFVRGLVNMFFRQFPWWDPVRSPDTYRDIIQVVERVDGNEDPSRWQAQRVSWLLEPAFRLVMPGGRRHSRTAPWRRLRKRNGSSGT